MHPDQTYVPPDCLYLMVTNHYLGKTVERFSAVEASSIPTATFLVIGRVTKIGLPGMTW